MKNRNNLTLFIIAVMLALICVGLNGQRGELATEQIKSIIHEIGKFQVQKNYF